MSEFSHLYAKKQVRSRKSGPEKYGIKKDFVPGVFYIRVSTGEQEESGNGLSAQKHSILEFAKKYNIQQVGGWFEEIVSGGADLSKRPVLESAMRLAYDAGGYVVTSKLDRLSRDSALINNLIRDQYKFVTVEHGFWADNLQLRIIAAVGEKERQMIGERTKDAMAAIKRRYLEEYERDVRELGPGVAVLKRLGIPDAKNCEKHYSKVLKAEAEGRRKYYLNEVFIPSLREFEKKPSLRVFVERINELGFRTVGDENPFTESTIKECLKKGFDQNWGDFLKENFSR